MNCTEILLQMQSRCFVFISEFIQSDIQQSAVCPKGGAWIVFRVQTTKYRHDSLYLFLHIICHPFLQYRH